MDIKIADRLLALRKKAGYSQDELADKLGVSRQAVSKWERGEAAPDTDNLISLSKLYGVSLDDIVNYDKAIPNVNTADQEFNDTRVYKDSDGNRVEIDDDGIHVHASSGTELNLGGKLAKLISNKIEEGVGKGSAKFDDEEWRIEDRRDENKGTRNVNVVINDGNSGKRVWLEAVKNIPIAIVTVLAYLLLGFLCDLWHPGWLVFFLVPIYYGIWDAVEKRDLECVPVAIIVTGVYLLLGCQWGLWHPYWALFLIIPVYHVSVAPISKKYRRNRTIVISDGKSSGDEDEEDDD